MDAAALMALVRRRFGPPARWAVFTEVHDGTGASHRRSCDAIAMALWPSDGLEIHGIEIKVARADWLRELRSPSKSEGFRRHCDRWWLVAADSGVATKEECLGVGWGMLRPRGDALVVSVGAPVRQAEPMPRKMLAALLRRAQEGSPGDAERSVVRAQAWDAGHAEGRRTAPEIRGLADVLATNAALGRSVDAFEAASGIRIGMYDGAEIGRAVARLRHLADAPDLIAAFARLGDDADRTARMAADAVGAMKEALGMTAQGGDGGLR